MSMNKCTCEVSKIRTHQTLIKLGRNRIPYKTPEYKLYEYELRKGMQSLEPVKDANVPLMLVIRFNVKDGVQLPEWRLINEKGNTCGKVHSNAVSAIEANKDNHRIEHTPAIVKYGVVGDLVNVVKPVEDALELFARIPNDRQNRKLEVDFTFNNDFNSIDIEIIELETVVKNGIYHFKA